MGLFGNLFKVRDLLVGKDNKPIELDFILLNDQCSRLLTSFIHKHRSHCVKLIIISQDDGEDHINIDNIPNMSDQETSYLLLAAASEVVGNGH